MAVVSLAELEQRFGIFGVKRLPSMSVEIFSAGNNPPPEFEISGRKFPLRSVVERIDGPCVVADVYVEASPPLVQGLRKSPGVLKYDFIDGKYSESKCHEMIVSFMR